MISRRDLLKLAGFAGIGSTALSGYAVAEAFHESVTPYTLTPLRTGTPGLKLRLAVLADLHVCDPWMSIQRLEQIVGQTNALDADAILLLGDFVVGHGLGKYSARIDNSAWAAVLAKLKRRMACMPFSAITTGGSRSRFKGGARDRHRQAWR